jgi:multidrug efflux system membrane fusion protein
MQPQNDQYTLRRNLRRAAIAASCVAAGIVGLGTYTRLVEASDLKNWTREAEIPTVALIAPTAGAKAQSLILPGTLEAFYDARIYARVPGYVQAWYKDIGARVKKGDLLASIETPELDQQIMQANADLSAAQAAQKLSDLTAKRWESLLPLDAVSKQDVEEKDEDLATKTGAVKAAKANLDRLQAMKDFARITAPFDGVVTRRNIDIGALVSAGPSSSGDPLFAVSDIHALRLYVNVPQTYSSQIVPGMTASLNVPEYPGKVFAAKLVSTANAISAGSSTLLVEFKADNRDGLLKPGDFAQVSMDAPQTTAMLRLPAEALTFRSAGLEVATVDKNDRVVMRRISIATDLGTQVVVGSGLSPTDRVVDNPPDSLANGDKVRIGSNAD